MVFPVRFATIYRVIKKKIACPQKQPTPSISVPGILLPIQSLASLLFLYGNFGNIIMLLLSKQLPRAAVRGQMASTSHYNITIQKSPFISLKRCCPDLPHTVIYSHIDTMHFISKRCLRHIIQTAGKLAVLVRKTLAEYNCHRLQANVIVIQRHSQARPTAVCQLLPLLHATTNFRSYFF